MKTKCQNVIIDLDNYKELKEYNDIPYNITITRSKKDPIKIPSYFLNNVKFNRLKFENVYNVVGINDFFMSGAECVNKNKMKFYFPDLETIGSSFLSTFMFNNKITFNFPRLKEIDSWFFGVNINCNMNNTLSELTIECGNLFLDVEFLDVESIFYCAGLNKLTIPLPFLNRLYKQNQQNINKIKIYIPKRMISNEIII